MLGSAYPGQGPIGGSPSGLSSSGAPPAVTSFPFYVQETFSLVVSVGGHAIHMRESSLSIVNIVGQQQTCDFDIVDLHSTVTPSIGQAIAVTENMVTIFAGDVDEVGLQPYESPYDSGKARMWTIKGVGQSGLAYRNVTGVFTAEVKAPIVLVLIALAANLGVGTNVTVAGNAALPEFFISDNETYASAFDRLADIASAVSGFRHIWTLAPLVVAGVGNVLTLHFGPIGFLGSGSGSSIGTTGYKAKEDTIRYRITRENYANRVVLKIDKHLRSEPETETFDFGDIFLGTLKLNFSCAGQPRVEVEGVEETVGIRDLDAGKDWYWNAGSPVLRVGDSGVSGGDEIIVTYEALDYRTVIAEDTGAIGSVGLFSIAMNSGDSGSSISPQAQANAFLARRLGYNTALRLHTLCPASAFQPGQSVTVTLPNLVSGTFYLRSVRHFDQQGIIVWRELELLNGPGVFTSAQIMGRLTR